MARRFESIFGGEYSGRLEFRTINGICARIINQYGKMIGKRPFSLLSDDKGIPYRIKSMDMSFFTNSVVMDITNIMRFALNPKSTELFMQI